MTTYQKESHSVCDIKYCFVWITKYRHRILTGEIALRTRDLLRQGCEVKNIQILGGGIGADHVRMLLACPASMSPGEIMKHLKGRTSRFILEEFPELKKQHSGQHMWARGYFCATVGEVDRATIERYIRETGDEDCPPT